MAEMTFHESHPEATLAFPASPRPDPGYLLNLLKPHLFINPKDPSGNLLATP